MIRDVELATLPTIHPMVIMLKDMENQIEISWSNKMNSEEIFNKRFFLNKKKKNAKKLVKSN